MSDDLKAILFSGVFMAIGILIFIGTPFLFILAGNYLGLFDANYTAASWFASLTILLLLGGVDLR